MWCTWRITWLSVDVRAARGVVFVTRRNRFLIFISHGHFAALTWHMIHIVFNLPPPTSITNMLAIRPGCIHPRIKAHICMGVCALPWEIWNCHNDCVFNVTKISKNAGYLQCYIMDLYVVLHCCNVQRVRRYGLWVQPLKDGSTRYIQLVWKVIQ